MIISPPFLPARNTGQSDAAWLEVAMAAPPSRLVDTGAPEGSFPLSHSLLWHNGMHLQAPQTAGTGAAARAIADGTVIFANAATLPNDNVDDPQNYNPFDRQGVKTSAWTDNGCVIIEHRTTIGAVGAVETEIVFYSLYMHLSALGKITRAGQTTKSALQAGDRVYRKDEVGTPGRIYGDAGQIHFEICFDQANLQNLIGRAPTWVDPATLPAPTADGRTDAVFGSLYFYLPDNTPTHPGPTRLATILNSTAGAATNLDAKLWVKMTYDQGACTFESYNEFGGRIGAMPAEANADCDLYKEANTRHNSLSAADKAVSSPSGWYELLRFGRNLGHGPADTDRDRLPIDAAHWRRIPGPDGAARWANLNAEGSYKFSDADFPAAMGWNCVSDDTSPDDQRCDSSNLKMRIRSLIETDPQDMEPPGDERLTRALSNTDVLAMLRRTFCKFPSEWEKATIAARYGFVKDLSPFKEPNAPNAWPRFEAHLNGICFDDLPSAYLGANWRAHPRELLGQLRKCGWLSATEFAQCFPRKLKHLTRTSFHDVITPWATVLSRATRWARPFNVENRRYGVSATKQRLMHYFSHVIPETGFLSMVKEGDSKDGTYLRGQAYWPYYGRGLIQLTWLDKYKEYGEFRGFEKRLTTGTFAGLGWNPDTAIATSNSSYDAVNCSDSACFFVVSKVGMLDAMDIGISTADAVDVSKYVNGRVAIQNLNGLEVRLQTILFLRDVLLDGVADSLSESLTFDWRRNSEKELTGRVNSKGKPEKAFILRTWTIDVPLERQRP